MPVYVGGKTDSGCRPSCTEHSACILNFFSPPPHANTHRTRFALTWIAALDVLTEIVVFVGLAVASLDASSVPLQRAVVAFLGRANYPPIPEGQTQREPPESPSCRL